MTTTRSLPRSFRDAEDRVASRREADSFESSVERWSTTPHEHTYHTCIACLTQCGLQICTRCGGWQERIEGRIV